MSYRIVGDTGDRSDGHQQSIRHRLAHRVKAHCPAAHPQSIIPQSPTGRRKRSVQHTGTTDHGQHPMTRLRARQPVVHPCQTTLHRPASRAALSPPHLARARSLARWAALSALAALNFACRCLSAILASKARNPSLHKTTSLVVVASVLPFRARDRARLGAKKPHEGENRRGEGTDVLERRHRGDPSLQHSESARSRHDHWICRQTRHPLCDRPHLAARSHSARPGGPSLWETHCGSMGSPARPLLAVMVRR
jgi:hypothetical protein